MWSCGDPFIRGLWNFDPEIIFLNHGSYGAIPLQVREAFYSIQNQIEQNPFHFLSRQLPERLMAARHFIAPRFKVDPEGLAFVSNASSGIGAVLTSLLFEEGDEIVFHNHGYAWVRQGLLNLSRKTGVVIREAVLPMRPKDDGDILDAFAQVIGPRTKLVITDHISSPTALVFPVTKIVALAHQQSIPVLVDGAHAPGMVELDLQSIGADFYTGNFHKWVCAPRGAGFLWVRPQWRNIVRPQSLCYAGGVTHHLWDQSFVGFFDWTGTSDFAAWLAVPEAFRFHDELGWQRVYSERKTLLAEGCRIYFNKCLHSEEQASSDSFRCAMSTLPLPVMDGLRADPVTAKNLSSLIYEKFKIEIPVVSFEGRLFVRVSAQIYNQLSDFERLADAIKNVCGKS